MKRIVPSAAALAAAALVVFQGTVSAAPLPTLASPASQTPAAQTAWFNQWQTWVKTTIAENNGYWKPIMGAKFSQPGLKLVGATPIQTPCGPESLADTRAAYCPGDHTIYVNPEFLEKQENTYGTGAAKLILDHEFGHHIQEVQGLPWRGMFSELQADCLAGAALQSQSTAEKLDFNKLVSVLLKTTDAAGDPNSTTNSHGTGDERVSALINGWNNLSTCQLTDTSGFYYPSSNA